MNESRAQRPDAGVVIIGCGQAGGRAAEALRLGGHAGPITMIGEESHPPYERPALSKGFLHDASLERVQSDLDTLKQAIGLEPSFGWEDVRMGRWMGVASVFAVIWAVLTRPPVKCVSGRIPSSCRPTRNTIPIPRLSSQPSSPMDPPITPIPFDPASRPSLKTARP